MNKYTLLVAGVLVSATNAFAACNLSSASDLFNEIKKNHPKIIQNNNSIGAKEKSVEYLNTWTNPEFSLDASKGEEADGKIKKIGASIMQPIEINGKKRANYDLSKAQSKKEALLIERDSENIVIDSVLKIHKLSQLYRIIPHYLETKEAYGKILNNKQQRPSLSPEEEVEKEALLLAIRDNDLKISKLENEKEYLRKHLAFYGKLDCEINQKNLPSVVDWSKVAPEVEGTESLELREAKLELDRAKKNLVLQEKESFSTIKIGPTFELEELEGKKYKTFGLSLSFDLPLSRQSKYLRQSAQYEIANATVALKETESESKIDRELWLRKFTDLKKTLIENRKNNQLEKKHDRIESLFKRGIISTALVIESHRQLLEFANTQDEFELDALEALWHIHSLDGNVLKADFI